MPFPYSLKQSTYNGAALKNDTWPECFNALREISSKSFSEEFSLRASFSLTSHGLNDQDLIVYAQNSNEEQTPIPGSPCTIEAFFGKVLDDISIRLRRRSEHSATGETYLGQPSIVCQYPLSTMAPKSPRIPVRVRSRSPTMTSFVDETADSTTLIESTQQTIPGSPLKNEVRPDSSCSNKVNDGAPRPIYQITQLAPPSQPKIQVSVFACHPANDGKFLLGRRKDTGTGQHQRWMLPTSDIKYKETFEHAALRILDRQATMHAAPATAALLHTTQTVPTDVLPNGGQHTITVFMGLWVKDQIDLMSLSNDKDVMEWRWVSWDNMSIKAKSFGKRGKKNKAKMTLSEFYDLVDPLKQLKWLHYTDDFHPVDELKSKIACQTASKKSGGHCCVVQ